DDLLLVIGQVEDLRLEAGLVRAGDSPGQLGREVDVVFEARELEAAPRLVEIHRRLARVRRRARNQHVGRALPLVAALRYELGQRADGEIHRTDGTHVRPVHLEVV